MVFFLSSGLYFTLLGWAADLEVGVYLRKPGRPGLLLANENEEEKLASFIHGVATLSGPIDHQGIQVNHLLNLLTSSFFVSIRCWEAKW